MCTCPNLLTGNAVFAYKRLGEWESDHYCAACLTQSFIGLSLEATSLAYIRIGTLHLLKTEDYIREHQSRYTVQSFDPASSACNPMHILKRG